MENLKGLPVQKLIVSYPEQRFIALDRAIAKHYRSPIRLTRRNALRHATAHWRRSTLRPSSPRVSAGLTTGPFALTSPGGLHCFLGTGTDSYRESISALFRPGYF